MNNVMIMILSKKMDALISAHLQQGFNALASHAPLYVETARYLVLKNVIQDLKKDVPQTVLLLFLITHAKGEMLLLQLYALPHL